MPASKTIKVRARLREATPDITDYQKYKPTLDFENVFVEFELPASAGRLDGDQVILTEEGYGQLLTQAGRTLMMEHMKALRKVTQ